MITILITAIIVAVIGIVLWQTKGFKNLREKNRAAEEKEESQVHYSTSVPWVKDQVMGIAEEDAKSGEVFGVKINEAVVDPAWKAQVNPDDFTVTFSSDEVADMKPIQDPPKVRVEISAVYDYIKNNIVDFVAIYSANLGVNYEFSKRSTNETKDIIVKDGTIYISDLDTKFHLLPGEDSIFANLAKEESERRAVEASVITHEKLKKFAERLPRGEKKVGSVAKTRAKAPTKKVSKGKK